VTGSAFHTLREVTVDEIAASAGTTRTTFYQHFASKSQLMQAVIRDVDEIFTTADDPPLAMVILTDSWCHLLT